jgi:hypothetical protein
MGQLPAMWDLLGDWGAPVRLDADPALLGPLWTVVCGVLEHCSGAQFLYSWRI